EHGGEDGVVHGELLIAVPRPVDRTGPATAQRHPVALKDLPRPPCHGEPEGLGEQQVLRALLRAGSAAVHISPLPRASPVTPSMRPPRHETSHPTPYRNTTMPRGNNILTERDIEWQDPKRSVRDGVGGRPTRSRRDAAT